MLSIKKLSYSINDKNIINKLSLSIFYNSLVALYGESGCGKTTLLKIIAGFIRPQGGEIYIDNVCVFSSNTYLPPFLRNISFAFQDDGLWPHLTVEQHFFLSWNKNSYSEFSEFQNYIIDVLKLSSLFKCYPHQLSGGESRRVSIARALGVDKKIYLLDEPLAHLDSENKTKVMELLLCLCKNFDEKIVFAVSHEPIIIESCNGINFLKYKLNSGRLESI